MTRIAFLDTETTSLRHDRRAWEIGAIIRDPGMPEVSRHWFVDAADLDLGNADLMSLKVGRFYERHPDMVLAADPGACIPDAARLWSERKVMAEVEAITRGAHLAGAVVNFIAGVLGARMRAHGICPSWHYHLICVENLAVGYLAGSPAYGASASGRKRQETSELIAPPWKSDDLTAALGLDPVPDDERHTALGDARWAMRIYDKVMGT